MFLHASAFCILCVQHQNSVVHVSFPVFLCVINSSTIWVDSRLNTLVVYKKRCSKPYTIDLRMFLSVSWLQHCCRRHSKIFTLGQQLPQGDGVPDTEYLLLIQKSIAGLQLIHFLCFTFVSDASHVSESKQIMRGYIGFPAVASVWSPWQLMGTQEALKKYLKIYSETNRSPVVGGCDLLR